MWSRVFRRLNPRFRQTLIKMLTDAEAGKSASVKPKKLKVFDHTRFARRRVLLMCSYLGWNYSGMAIQPGTIKTIERELFDALLKTKLVESIETCNFSRCGRTDAGVSGFRQVVSLDVRTDVSTGPGVFIPEGHDLVKFVKFRDQSSMNYPKLLNKVLPRDIRVLAWAPVEQGFNARFGCQRRMYKYYFPKANLNIEHMKRGAELLIGTHDYRNFCKIDLSNNFVRDTTRTVYDVTIAQADPARCLNDGNDMYVLTVVGRGFLWHQIRGIVSVLILIGREKESPDIVEKLFDIETVPRRPAFVFALETPLVLYDCMFDDVKWEWNVDTRKDVITTMQRQWADVMVKAQMLKDMSEALINEDPVVEDRYHQTDGFLMDGGRQGYVSLLKRPTCAYSVEDLQQNCETAKRRKEAEAEQETERVVDDVIFNK